MFFKNNRKYIFDWFLVWADCFMKVARNVVCLSGFSSVFEFCDYVLNWDCVSTCLTYKGSSFFISCECVKCIWPILSWFIITSSLLFRKTDLFYLLVVLFISFSFVSIFYHSFWHLFLKWLCIIVLKSLSQFIFQKVWWFGLFANYVVAKCMGQVDNITNTS